jgi:ribosomal protein L12E/L44/L45/RPP1/RPP2
MRFMMSREGDYAKAAPHADVWLIQSQRFQVDRDKSKHATPEEYRKNVQRIVNLIHQGNLQTKIWVQIIICPGARAGNDFSAEEIVRLARAIEDIVDAVRIYTAGAAKGTETLKEVIRLLRAPAPKPPATTPPAPAAAQAQQAAPQTRNSGDAKFGIMFPGNCPGLSL